MPEERIAKRVYQSMAHEVVGRGKLPCPRKVKCKKNTQKKEWVGTKWDRKDKESE